MNPSINRPRRARLPAPAWCSAALLAVSSALAGAAPGGTDPAPAVQSLTFTNGQEIHAAITGYSLQSRTITLETPGNQRIQVGPRDLTAGSKLKWLSSPAFVQTMRHYNPPADAVAATVRQMAGPVFAVILGGFLSFWLAVALIGGQKRMLRAATTYSKVAALAVLIATATLFVTYSVSKSLGDSPVAPMVQSACLLVGIVAFVSMANSRIGTDYDFSGGTAFGAILLSAGLSVGLGIGLLHFLPLWLGRPGVDVWLTDQLLAPLGLA